MLATIKGLSRHKRLPPTSGETVTGKTTNAASAPDAVPPIYSTIPLTVAPRGAVRRLSGRGTSFGRDVFAAPLPGASNWEQDLTTERGQRRGYSSKDCLKPTAADDIQHG